MRAFTLHQPYASLVAIGTKPWETRPRAAPESYIGTRIAIHAGKSHELMGAYDDDDIRAALYIGGFTRRDQLPMGVIVCTALLAGCYQVEHLRRDRLPAVPRAVIGARVAGSVELNGGSIATDPFGDYAPGRWLLWLKDIERIEPPIPARGMQGWWPWGDPR